LLYFFVTGTFAIGTVGGTYNSTEICFKSPTSILEKVLIELEQLNQKNQKNQGN
jgi:hypothetical protein